MNIYRVKNRESEGYHWRGSIFGLTNVKSGASRTEVRDAVIQEAYANMSSYFGTLMFGVAVLAGGYACLFAIAALYGVPSALILRALLP